MASYRTQEILLNMNVRVALTAFVFNPGGARPKDRIRDNAVHEKDLIGLLHTTGLLR